MRENCWVAAWPIKGGTDGQLMEGESGDARCLRSTAQLRCSKQGSSGDLLDAGQAERATRRREFGRGSCHVSCRALERASPPSLLSAGRRSPRPPAGQRPHQLPPIHDMPSLDRRPAPRRRSRPASSHARTNFVLNDWSRFVGALCALL
jgi:hypothetical protein